jgi:uncharacterized protein (TIGR01777 family)
VKVVIAGATGLVGRHLIAALTAQGHDVVALVRRDGKVTGARTERWGDDGAVPVSALSGAAAIVNLAGEGIGTKRWSRTRRESLVASRVASTKACAEALGSNGPTTLVNASAVGYYGVTDHAVDESSPRGDDFLSDLCAQWEDAVQRGDLPPCRTVSARFGVILARDGGALPTLVRTAKLGLNGPLGGGRQWISWIHIDDVVDVLMRLLVEEVHGPVNVVAPSPLRQRDFARALGRVLRRPSFLPTPGFAVQAAIGRGPASLALTGQRVMPAVLDAMDYHYRFGDIDAALENLVGRNATAS